MKFHRAGTFALAAVAAFMLAACETPTTQRYAISADNNQAIRAFNSTGVGFGEFAAPATFSATCRALGPLQVADGLTHTQYIKRAFEDEFKIAGASTVAGTTPRVLITGRVTRLEFSSARGLTGGSWDIDLTLTSSNGRSMAVGEHYEFNSGFAANEACRNTADAFSRAVQDLVGKTLRDPAFRGLIA